MKTISLLCLCTVLSFCVKAQRHLPYPIIFIHGFNGNASTWNEFNSYLSARLGLSIEYNNIDICLNADGDTRFSYKYRDVYLYTPNLGNRDVYRVNFDVCQSSLFSNQSGAVKQGYALRFAIQSVLNATGAEKVILFGHSMGGLAAREYLQNPGNWQGDRQHHVAKLITLGTPHGGSNLGSGDINLGSLFGYNEASEAVRDLRTSYKTDNQGTFLFGGIESINVIQRGFGSLFHNIDVDSDGYVGSVVMGLNRKSIYTNLAHSNIIASGIMGFTGDSDGIVLSSSQDLARFYNIDIDKFYHKCPTLSCHTNEPKEAIFPSMYALDEPSATNLAYQIELNRMYTGTFTNQSNGSFLDQDKFKIFASQRGLLYFSGDFPAGSNPQFRVINQSGYVVATASHSANRILTDVILPSSGTYYLEITGTSPNGWSRYSYSTSFCPMPSQLSISGSSSLTFCEGQSITISANSGYDEYRWYLDGQQIAGTSNSILASKSGVYSAQAIKCGIITQSNNTLKTVVLPTPPKPTIVKNELPDGFQLTSNSPTNNQWYLNNQPIPGATSNEYIPQALGDYYVAINQQSCISISDTVSVRMDQPELTIQGKNPSCVGDSVLLIAPTGYGSYIFSNGEIEKLQSQNSIVVKQTSTYTLKTKRGIFISPPSSPIDVVVNQLPTKPTITLQGYSLFSSSQTDNQWFLNSLPIDTTQELKHITSGLYAVRVTKLGCFTDSDPFIITATDPSENGHSFKVYPNPTSGQLYLDIPQNSAQTNLTITDLSGKVIMNNTISSQGTHMIDFNQPSGLYIIQIKSGEFQGIYKLLVR